MGDLEDLGQKIKGQGQQIRGDFKHATGDHIGGTIDDIKGKFNEEIADMKIDNNVDDEDDEEL